MDVTFSDDVIASTIGRVVSATDEMYRRTGMDPKRFSIVMHPQRWLAMTRDPLARIGLIESDYVTGVRRLRGQPVVLDSTMALDALVLRTEVDA